MGNRPAGLLYLIICLFLVLPVAAAAERDVKPTKTIVRADDGLGIVCESRGGGDTSLVFLHGWCGDREYWKNQVDVFAADYRVIAIDQAGHGESGTDRKQWAIDSLAEDVESVAKSLGLTRVVVIGHSMGGPVGLLAAKRMPGTVVAVIGVDTLQNVESPVRADLVQKFLADIQTDFKAAVRSWFPSMLHEKTDPGLKQWLIAKAEAQNPTMAIGLTRDLLDLDMKMAMKDAKVPVRCINSGGGYQFYTPTAVATNRQYADYDAVIIDAVGHYPMLEKPTEFNQRLRDVLKEFVPKRGESR